MVYMATLPGGWIADRLIGQRRAVFWGGVVISSGHFSMAFPSITTFYFGLFLIVVGTGLLKGNVSVIVGQLYGPKDNRRDAGFSIFYMGINLGAFIGPLIAGWLALRYGWRMGFLAAAGGMPRGMLQFWLSRGLLGGAGVAAHRPDGGLGLARDWKLLGAAIVVLCVAAFLVMSGLVSVNPAPLANGEKKILYSAITNAPPAAIGNVWR